jgi:5-methylthioadenosine/S-adenosylhomocysteine deaminase
MDDGRRTIRDGAMVIRDDRIVHVGEKKEEWKEGAGEVVDGSRRVFLPGLVNTHGHAAMSLLRGYADDLDLQVWLEQKMWPMEAKFAAEDVRAGALLTAAEMIKSGTTCFVDMYDHMDEVARVAEESGLRAVLCRGVIGFPAEAQDAKLAEAKSFARNWNGAAGGRIRTMMAPHAPYTCPPAYIERIVAAAHELDVPLHTHMSETVKEVEQNVADYGARPVEHLLRLGVFSRPCLVAHAVHLTDEEIAILAEHGVSVSHNPGSNLKLASGIARVRDMLKAGVTVSLGTDSSASNNNVDMFDEIRLAALLQKGATLDPTAVPAAEALAMATEYGAAAVWQSGVFGRLAPGMKADFIAVDVDQPHFYPHTDLVSHLVYSASGHDVTDVCVDGRWLMRNRELLTLDEERIKHEAGRRFDRLLRG